MLQANGDITVQIPPKLLPYWREEHRYKGLKGGRGSTKSHSVAHRLVIDAATTHVRAACMREIQNSIKDSSKQLLEDKIVEHFGSNQRLFKITDREITCPSTDSLFIFRGLQNHTASSIKSLEAFNRGWYEEAQALSQKSIELATPTFRAGSEQTFTWNPEDGDDDKDEKFDPVGVFFRNGMEDQRQYGGTAFQLIDINYVDNPWFEETGLRADMERDKRRDYDKYLHIWMGHKRSNSEARVFKNVKSLSFDTPLNAVFLHGADWGFSIDPTVLLRCFTGDLVDGQAVYNPDGRCLFIDAEAYQVGCRIEDTPALFDNLGLGDKIAPPPGLEKGSARKWPIRADSSDPQLIDYMQRNGYPLIVPATKGPNSIVEGITFLQDYDIIVHPRAPHALDEFNFYSYKVDKRTKQITRELSEKKNHVIDSARYALEEVRKVAFQWYVGG